MLVDLVLFYGLPVAGLALAMWQGARRARVPVAENRWDEQVDIAIAVALHEAGSRDQDIHPIHLLYGLLQDSEVEQEEDAIRLMRQTHIEGEAFVGRFPRADAMSKLSAAHERARSSDSPLLVRWRESMS